MWNQSLTASELVFQKIVRTIETFSQHGFGNDEIYYLSPKQWADFNGDGLDDHIVDAPKPERPLTVEDVAGAFAWAKTQGKLSEPLYLFFMGHGNEGKLRLTETTILTAEQLKTMLDDYQVATGNEVIVVIEASHSGSFLVPLAAPKRAIISSTKADGLSWWYSKKEGFSYFFTSYLSRGASFFEAFQFASRDVEKEEEKMGGGTGTRTPQLDDTGDGLYTQDDGQWLKTVFPGGEVVRASSARGETTSHCDTSPANRLTFTVQGLSATTTLQAAQPFLLKTQVTLSAGTVTQVWAEIQPPRDLLQEPENVLLSSSQEAGSWQATWSNTHFNGDYQITFKAKNDTGNITSSEPATITVVNGLNPPQQQAAIIITGNLGGDDSLLSAARETASYIYRMFKSKEFTDEDIYYLTSETAVDYNGDGTQEDVVDKTEKGTPLTLTDVNQAFAWAKMKGTLKQPLYLFFVTHGSPGKLVLSKEETINADQLRKLLDDYQTVTSNAVVIFIDACYSGSFLELLTFPRRAIIASASANENAFFPNTMGFSYHLATYLMSGTNILDAFNTARSEQWKELGVKTEAIEAARQATTAESAPLGLKQNPVLDDDNDGKSTPNDGQWLRTLYISGNKPAAAGNLMVKNLTKSFSIQAGQPLTLQLQVEPLLAKAKHVWVTVRPPRMSQVSDLGGTPILDFPRFDLSPQACTTPCEGCPRQCDWQFTDATAFWRHAIYNGDYETTFYAEDSKGEVTASDSLTITVTGGAELPQQPHVHIQLAKDRYQIGESFQATLTENLGWGYDLYAAVVLLDGNFLTLTGPNTFAAAPNQPAKWQDSNTPRSQNQPLSILDLTLPVNLSAGRYCLYGILSPKGQPPVETMPSWVSEQQCFEVF